MKSSLFLLLALGFLSASTTGFSNSRRIKISHSSIPSLPMNNPRDVIARSRSVHFPAFWKSSSSSSSLPLSSSPDASRSTIDSKSSDGVNEQNEDLTVDKIAEMIEVSFVKACMELSQGFVDVLKLFIAATKAGYEAGIPVPTLLQKVEECPVQSAGRSLMAEELDLRSTWINIIYLTLKELHHSSSSKDLVCNSISEEVKDKFQPLIEGAIRAKNSAGVPKFGSTITLTIKDVVGLESNRHLDLEGTILSKCRDDPMENAIIAQSLRVIFMTVTVLQEEQLCNESDDTGVNKNPPQPPIPGTY